MNTVTQGPTTSGLMSKEELREKIHELIENYHSAAFPPQPFLPGQSAVPVSGKLFDASELKFAVDACLDFWLTSGRFAAEFERRFARFMETREARLVNSGSSANLLAVSCLTSPSLGGRQLLPGDEVITLAAGFPTTVNPILQNGLVPVFVDIRIPTYDVDFETLKEAVSDRTRAIVLAHTLGNPFDAETIRKFAESRNLWFIEDCCDAVGARFRDRSVGTFGHLATVSFYPAHHITMGEGGCVLTDKPALAKLVESFRDWGRDCWCPPGRDNTCGKRFDWQLGSLPCGYDHKYTYSHIGYNLKLSDMQAAVGLAQLDKLPQFILKRQSNFARLRLALQGLTDFFYLPETIPGAEPSWFGFPLGIKPDVGLSRDSIVRALEERKIATRLLFGGNLTRQPAYRGANYRVVGELRNSDYVMANVFWIGVFPGISDEMIDYMAATLYEIVENR